MSSGTHSTFQRLTSAMRWAGRTGTSITAKDRYPTRTAAKPGRSQLPGTNRFAAVLHAWTPLRCWIAGAGTPRIIRTHRRRRHMDTRGDRRRLDRLALVGGLRRDAADSGYANQCRRFNFLRSATAGGDRQRSAASRLRFFIARRRASATRRATAFTPPTTATPGHARCRLVLRASGAPTTTPAGWSGRRTGHHRRCGFIFIAARWRRYVWTTADQRPPAVRSTQMVDDTGGASRMMTEGARAAGC